jgi:hypothetical protein
MALRLFQVLFYAFIPNEWPSVVISFGHNAHPLFSTAGASRRTIRI